jgi:predicted RNA-binding Zn-ribbon protein involved in translation (DUF1610 family)
MSKEQSRDTPPCESCERLAIENEQLRGAVTIWQKLADERKEQIAAQSERLVALSETAHIVQVLPLAPQPGTVTKSTHAAPQVPVGEGSVTTTGATSPAVAAPSDDKKCDVCGGELAKSVLDRGGQEYWCPSCAKAEMRKLKAERDAMRSAEVLMSESSLHSKASAWDKIQAKLTELTGSEEWLRGEGNGTQCAIAVIERFARSAIVRRSPDEIDLICDAYIAKTAEFQCPPKFYSHLREALHAILRPTDSCTPNDV